MKIILARTNIFSKHGYTVFVLRGCGRMWHEFGVCGKHQITYVLLLYYPYKFTLDVM